MTVISLMFALVVIPAILGYCVYMESPGDDPNTPFFVLLRSNLHRLLHGEFERGDLLIYRKSKVSPRPGPRARNVQAAENGDDYYYEVDKFWVVSDVLNDGRLVAVTRTGKRVYLAPEDERMRKAGWLERVRYRGRFPVV